MKERPILFSSPMVRAILDGRKTQTRRVIRCNCNSWHINRMLGEWSLSEPPHKWDGDLDFLWNWHGPKPNEGDWVEQWQTDVDDHAAARVSCPYGAPGDRLWVKETWAVDPCHDDLAPRDLPYSIEEDLRLNPEIAEIRYLADSAARLGKTRPSIYMPRWASRITLEIVSVRVERVQDINRGDATCEGCPFPNMADGSNPKWWFRDLWDSINAKCGYGWDANPWVWVIEFKRIGKEAA